jgi:hypothetical protein
VRSRALGAIVLVALVLAGCDGSTKEEASRDAQVYVATIRDVLADQSASERPGVLPVVYVVGVGEKRITAIVQAEVAAALDEDAEIRFADKRDEALLTNKDNVPVRDDGVLVALGEVPPDADPVEVHVEVYRSDDDWSKLVLTIGTQSSQWTVTSESVVPPEGS